MSFADKLKQYAENAPVRTGASNYFQYGLATGSLNVLTWQGKGNAPKKAPYKEGMEIEAGKQALELTVSVNVKELNPALQFDDWSRKVLIESSNKTSKDPRKWILTDWSETVLPSLENVFGDKWADFCLGKLSVYAEVEQADSQFVGTDKATGEKKKDYGVPKFHRQFKTIDQCRTARDERYGTSNEGVNETTEELGIPEDVIAQAKSLFKSLKNNKAKLIPLLDSEPFNAYDPDAILAELGV